MNTTEDRMIWLGAGVMGYAILQIAGLYYGLFFILGLGLVLWGVLRKTRGKHATPPRPNGGDDAGISSPAKPGSES